MLPSGCAASPAILLLRFSGRRKADYQASTLARGDGGGYPVSADGRGEGSGAGDGYHAVARAVSMSLPRGGGVGHIRRQAESSVRQACSVSVFQPGRRVVVSEYCRMKFA